MGEIIIANVADDVIPIFCLIISICKSAEYYSLECDSILP